MPCTRCEQEIQIERYNSYQSNSPCMKLITVLITLCVLAGSAAALSMPPVSPLFPPARPDLVYVSSFEGGHRLQAGDYPVIVLSGTFRQMGRQYGALMKAELNEEYRFISSAYEKRGYSNEQLRADGREASVLYSKRLKEVFSGMAETSGLTQDEVLALYNGLVIYLMVPPADASCSYLSAWGNYTTDGSVIASRNWDLDDVALPFNKWNVLVVYRPSDGSNGVATFGPAGVRAETVMNSKGLFIADDFAGFIDPAQDTRPDLVAEFFRFMLDYSNLAELDVGLRGSATNIGWIVNVAGPGGASVYEVTPNQTRQRTGDGVVAAANHFVDPAWNLPAPAEHSASRYDGLLREADEAKGSIDARRMMQIRDVRWEDGGATFVNSVLSPDHPEELYSTIHQVVFLPESRTVWIKDPDSAWQRVDLGMLFGE